MTRNLHHKKVGSKSIEWLFSWTKTWPNLKLKSGDNFKEMVAYERTSLWWFFEGRLHRVITELMAKERKPAYRRITFTRGSLVILKRYLLLAKFLSRCLFGNLFALTQKKCKNQRKIMLVSLAMNWGDPADPTLKKIKEDRMLGSLITEMKNRGWGIVALYEDASRMLNFRTLIEKVMYGEGRWRLIESYLTLNIIIRALRDQKKLKKKWFWLKKDPRFMKLFNFEGVDTFWSIKDDFEDFFNCLIFFYICYIELMKRTIELEKPDLILITCEYGPPGLAALIAGKLKGVPTLAVQHGIIHRHHTGYRHQSDEISDRIAPQYRPIPDKTAVYGDYTRKILTEYCNYPRESVAATGQPRYDILAKADKIFNKKDFCRRHSLDPNKKIVLLILEDFSVSHKFLRAAVRALKELPEVQTVIKPHPVEKGKWHKNVLGEENYDAVILDPKSNTYETLFACNLMMTVTSTVAIEAIFLNKPVGIVNLTKEPDPMPYVESGAAFGAYRERDVAPMIRKALFDQEANKELGKGRKEFVENHLHDVGDSAANVMKLIEEMTAS